MSELREAAELALEFLSSDRWGTVPYMDGAVYADAAELEKILRAALQREALNEVHQSDHLEAHVAAAVAAAVKAEREGST